LEECDYLLLIDRYLAKKVGKMPTLLAMLMDFIPESIAVKGNICNRAKLGNFTSSFLIRSFQNLREGFLMLIRDLILSGF